MTIMQEAEWCAHPQHKANEEKVSASGYRIEQFPSAHDIGIVLTTSIPMCGEHVGQELPRGIYSNVIVDVVVNRDLKGRRRK